MSTPDWPALIFVAAVACLFLPSLVQRIRRRRRVRANLRAAVLDNLRRDIGDALELAESNGSLAAAYRRANDRMYAFLREHMSVEEIRELDEGLTVYDRLVTDVMERATWGVE